MGSVYKFSVSHGIDSCIAEWTNAGADQFAASNAYAATGDSCDPYDVISWQEGVVPELSAAGGVYDVDNDPIFPVAGMCANMTSGEMLSVHPSGPSSPIVIDHSAVVDMGTNSTTVIAVSSLYSVQFTLYYCLVFELDLDGSISKYHMETSSFHIMSEDAFNDCHEIVNDDEPLRDMAAYTRVADDRTSCPSQQYVPTYDFLDSVAYTRGTFFAGERAAASDAVTFCSASEVVRVGSSADAAEN